MEENKTSRSFARHLRRVVGIAFVSLLLCGLFFPLLVTAAAQLAFPYQANGEISYLNGRPVGSLIAVNSTDYASPLFFHLRNNTASGFDPDITLQDAQSQIPALSSSTGIPTTTLHTIVDQNVEGVWWAFGSPYVNVQKVNLVLVLEYPSVYANFTKSVHSK